MFRLLAVLLSCLVGSFSMPAYALDNPRSPAILTLSGAIDGAAEGEMMRFDRAALEALDWREIRTFTSFTEGEQSFAGPTLASLLQAVGVSDGVLRATAVNDYTVEIPVSHAFDHDVLLALDHNGSPMTVRTKGPVWIVYPLSEDAAKRQPFDSEMIWQLVRIEVVR